MTTEEPDDTPTEHLLLEGYGMDCYTGHQLYDVTNNIWYPVILHADLKFNHVIPFEDRILFINILYDVSKDTSSVNIFTHDLDDMYDAQICTSEYAGWPIGVHKKFIYFHDNYNRQIHRLNAADSTFEANVFAFSERHVDSATIITQNGLLYNIGSFHPTDEESLCEVCDLETLEIKSIASFPVTSKNWATDQWKHPPTLARVSAAEFNDKLYAMDVRTLKQLYIYSPDEDRWNTITCDIPPYLIRGQLASCAGNLIFLNSGVLLYVYNTETNRWDRRERYGGHVMCAITCMRTIHTPRKLRELEDDEDEEKNADSENEAPGSCGTRGDVDGSDIP